MPSGHGSPAKNEVGENEAPQGSVVLARWDKTNVPARNRPRQDPLRVEEDMKKCPYCAEEIQEEAIKCRFCGEFLNKKKKWRNCLLGCLIAFIAYILLSVGFLYFVFLIPKLIFSKLFFGNFQLHPYQYPPSTNGGIEGFFRDFAEGFRQFWERIKDFLHLVPQAKRITF